MRGFGRLWQIGPQDGLILLSIYLGLAGVIFGLQVFPVPGIYFMMVAAPAWIGILTHVAMAHFAVAAIIGRLAWVWLALPIGFYVGGFGLHLASTLAARADASAINARNAAVKIYVDKPFSYLRAGPADSFALIEHYRVDRSFLVQGSGEITTSFYATDAECDAALKGYYYQRRNEPWAIRKDIFSYYTGYKTRQCILSQNGQPAKWRYRIVGNYSYEKDKAAWLYTRRGKVFEIYDTQEERLLGKIEVASFRPFGAVPWVVAGCGLDSGAARWECFLSLTRGDSPIVGGVKLRSKDDPQKNPFIPSDDSQTWEVTALAKALGLEPRQPTD